MTALSVGFGGVVVGGAAAMDGSYLAPVLSVCSLCLSSRWLAGRLAEEKDLLPVAAREDEEMVVVVVVVVAFDDCSLNLDLDFDLD